MAGFGIGSEIASVAATATVPITAPPETPKLPPREWVKANLFSSPFNSVLTVVSAAILLTLFWNLLKFIFNPIRQWNASATNLRLLMTRAYPEEQYLRIWVCVAIILTLAGSSMAVWRTGSAMPVTGLGRKLLATGALLVLLVLLAPFSAGATVQWLLAALVVAAVGEALRRIGGRGETERTVSTLTLQVVALAGLVASLWVTI